MRNILRAVVRKMRNLRALIKDEDHDSWLDEHPTGQKKSPNVGPNLGGGRT